MKTHLSPLLYLLLLLFTAGAGYAIGRFSAEPIVEVLPETVTHPHPQANTSTRLDLTKAQTEIAALRNENQQLRQRLEVEPTEDMPEEAQEVVAEPEEPRQRRTWQERMATLKEEDPERYEREMERRNQFVTAMRQMSEERDTFLNSIDLTLLTPEAQESHQRFTAANSRQFQLQEEMMAMADAGEDIPREMREEMGELFRELHETRDVERAILLDAIATSMGLSGTDVTDFTTLVNEVFNATGMQMPRMERPPRVRSMPPQPNR